VEIPSNAQNICNSSPVFGNPKKVLVLVDKTSIMDIAAVDGDGDELVYNLCEPWIGGGLDGSAQGAPANAFSLTGVAPDPDAAAPYQNALYNTGYSKDKPLGILSDFEINSETGRISFNPTIRGQFVVLVCVSEYRNEELLSVARQEFVMNVTDCTISTAKDLSDALNLYIQPNPSTELTNVQFDLKQLSKVSIELNNMIGAKLLARNYGQLQGSQNISFDISSLPTGIYLMKILIGNEVIVKKIAISR